MLLAGLGFWLTVPMLGIRNVSLWKWLKQMRHQCLPVAQEEWLSILVILALCGWKCRQQCYWLRKLTEPLTPDPLMVYLTPFCHRWKHPHSSSKPHRFHSNKPLDVMTHISFVSTEMSLAVVWKAQRELGRLIVAADASYYPQLVQHWLGIFIVFDNTNKKHDVVGAEEPRL